jgi:hypothetical protein
MRSSASNGMSAVENRCSAYGSPADWGIRDAECAQIPWIRWFGTGLNAQQRILRDERPPHTETMRKRPQPLLSPSPQPSPEGRGRRRGAIRKLFDLPSVDCLLDLGDGLGDLDLARAGFGAVKGSAAAPHTVAIAEDFETLGSSRVAAVKQETVGIH